VRGSPIAAFADAIATSVLGGLLGGIGGLIVWSLGIMTGLFHSGGRKACL
jgi:hypothetical protein